ncbi:MAG: type 1 glutamine amidotransferase [Melioribacteraceae bacterium]|nr:type 1 glutamine amidotransferase [Melioribacteraceae bacterium]
MESLTGKRVLMFVDHVYEDLELWYPKLRLIEEGAEVVVAGPEAGKVYEGKNGYPCKSDASYDSIDEKDFDGLVIPGGFAPDKLRRVAKVLELTKQFNTNKKLVAHICHAGWITISAKIMRGYKCTSTPGIKDDIENAGAIWVDEPLVIDRNMVSSRKPDDLPQFCKGIIEVLSKQKSI